MSELEDTLAFHYLGQQALDLLDRVREAFSMLPALHGAIPATVDEVRDEVNAALDDFWDELNVLLALAHNGRSEP